MPDIPEMDAKGEKAEPKQIFRKKIWDSISKNKLANFPLNVYNRIPNFKGAEEAARRILQLEEFKSARVIKINPDKPQEAVRWLALEANKEILVPIPRLKSGLFLRVTPDAGVGSDEWRNMATRRGLRQFGKPLGADSGVEVDLVVLGAVCVSRSGYRIGKGEGFADLEFAVMMNMGAINSRTTVITTVHDSQVVDDLPSHIFESYDVPVDIILTPTQTIYVEERLKKPSGILWERLTQRRVNSMEILRELRDREEKDGGGGGATVMLKEEDSTDEKCRYERRWIKRSKRSKRPRRIEGDAPTLLDNADDHVVEERKNEGDGTTGKGRSSRRRKLRERRDTAAADEAAAASAAAAACTIEMEREKKAGGRKSTRPRARANIDFSLKLSNIKSDVRVRHLKNALLERGVRANDITWHGQRGYCYLHFSKLRNKGPEADDRPVQVDSIVANLQRLQLGDAATEAAAADSASDVVERADAYIVVEPAKPITRIEVTDVTAV